MYVCVHGGRSACAYAWMSIYKYNFICMHACIWISIYTYIGMYNDACLHFAHAYAYLYMHSYGYS